MTQFSKDLKITVIAGLLIAFLAIPIINNLQLPSFLASFGEIKISATLFILTLAGYLLLNYLSRWLLILKQIAKFVIVGGLNTFLDFAVLNFLIASSGIVSGAGFSFFKGISFLVAVINSYFWNKYWTFESRNRERLEFIQFAVISTIGLFINVGVASFIVNTIGAPGTVSPALWANIGALIAVAASLVWNFLGYKFIVFHK
ncbi:MAG: GtrA family protein [Candidatus Colwellbacteria bacterium]|nr:GtrA family protein [Candidatus Colwellbacteria bacterium]MBI3088732.1 GtrA family protein [Candidatus Colwellbacteria bacterium]